MFIIGKWERANLVVRLARFFIFPGPFTDIHRLQITFDLINKPQSYTADIEADIL